jgi:hypothetical protein
MSYKGPLHQTLVILSKNYVSKLFSWKQTFMFIPNVEAYLFHITLSNYQINILVHYWNTMNTSNREGLKRGSKPKLWGPTEKCRSCTIVNLVFWIVNDSVTSSCTIILRIRTWFLDGKPQLLLIKETIINYLFAVPFLRWVPLILNPFP